MKKTEAEISISNLEPEDHNPHVYREQEDGNRYIVKVDNLASFDNDTVASALADEAKRLREAFCCNRDPLHPIFKKYPSLRGLKTHIIYTVHPNDPNSFTVEFMVNFCCKPFRYQKHGKGKTRAVEPRELNAAMSKITEFYVFSVREILRVDKPSVLYGGRSGSTFAYPSPIVT